MWSTLPSLHSKLLGAPSLQQGFRFSEQKIGRKKHTHEPHLYQVSCTLIWFDFIIESWLQASKIIERPESKILMMSLHLGHTPNQSTDLWGSGNKTRHKEGGQSQGGSKALIHVTPCIRAVTFHWAHPQLDAWNPSGSKCCRKTYQAMCNHDDHSQGKHALSLRTSHNLLFVVLNEDKELSEGNEISKLLVQIHIKICIFIEFSERPTIWTVAPVCCDLSHGMVWCHLLHVGVYCPPGLPLTVTLRRSNYIRNISWYYLANNLYTCSPICPTCLSSILIFGQVNLVAKWFCSRSRCYGCWVWKDPFCWANSNNRVLVQHWSFCSFWQNSEESLRPDMRAITPHSELWHIHMVLESTGIPSLLQVSAHSRVQRLSVSGSIVDGLKGKRTYCIHIIWNEKLTTSSFPSGLLNTFLASATRHTYTWSPQRVASAHWWEWSCRVSWLRIDPFWS